jgi:regulator of CtrA degradation
MSTPSYSDDPGAILLGERLVSSAAFRNLFREGMALVEESAAYLDGDGRAQSKGLARAAALAYATESMRLTTRLMQLASWLLLQRAVNEGEMTSDQARQEKTKVKLASLAPEPDEATLALLPEKLMDLIGQSLRLQSRIRHLDQVNVETTKVVPQRDNGVERQLAQLRRAFGAT